MTTPMRIGVIGLGSMGQPMAHNLIAAGYRVSGYDIAEAAITGAAQEGVEGVSDPAAMAAACELVLIMVWDDAALSSVVFGPSGLLASSRLPDAVVDLSTTSVAVARKIGKALDARGTSFLDAAVIGGGAAAARAGTSPIVVSGARTAYERYAAVLQRLGTCHYVGEQGDAKVVKIVNNLIVGAVTAANAEALSLGVAMGLDLGDLVGWMRRTPGGSRVLDSYMGRFVDDGRYGEGLIGHRLMAKDLQLAAELGESVCCPAVYPRLAQQMYLAFARELGDAQPFPSAFEYFRARIAPSQSDAELPRQLTGEHE